jgi:hypothetical protein
MDPSSEISAFTEIMDRCSDDMKISTFTEMLDDLYQTINIPECIIICKDHEIAVKLIASLRKCDFPISETAFDEGDGYDLDVFQNFKDGKQRVLITDVYGFSLLKGFITERHSSGIHPIVVCFGSEEVTSCSEQ